MIDINFITEETTGPLVVPLLSVNFKSGGLQSDLRARRRSPISHGPPGLGFMSLYCPKVLNDKHRHGIDAWPYPPPPPPPPSHTGRGRGSWRSIIPEFRFHSGHCGRREGRGKVGIVGTVRG